MTLLDVLQRAASQAGDVKKVLGYVRDQYPDLAAQIDPLIAALDAPLALDNLVNLASILPGEIAAIAQGRIDPRSHAGDAI